jgi:hypothetical protein
MSDYLEYDGQTLRWMPNGPSYPATSGLPEHQRPADQCLPDAGPIPKGTYYLQLHVESHKYATDDGTSRCNLTVGEGIQYIPRGGDPANAPKGALAGKCEPYWANWGWRRVRLEAADTVTARACMPRRGGFYIHDSSKGYSHGCIEVDSSFFTKLMNFASHTRQRRMLLKVSYKTSTTYGGTKGLVSNPPVR